MPKHIVQLYMIRNIQICVERGEGERGRELVSKLTDFSLLMGACVVYIHCSMFSSCEQSMYQSDYESSEN